MKSTQPVFILGSGRSGTFQIFKLLEGVDGIESHHEYLFENILKTSVMHRMGLVTSENVKSILNSTHGAAIHYSNARYWLDSSNALPWIIQPLYELFPDAYFIHLIRDGRKVVSSFYHKFGNIMYADYDVGVLRNWMNNPMGSVEPPPEKKYWRPLPIQGEHYFKEFESFDRFQRLCYYWQDVNMCIKRSFATIPSNQQLTLRLEDVVKYPEKLEKILMAFGIKYNDSFMRYLDRPVNVHIPQNFPLSTIQNTQFHIIAGHAMTVFGYDKREEYDVIY